VQLEQAFSIVRHVVDAAPAAISVYVVDGTGEVVAAASMDGALPESRLTARGKALAGHVGAYDRALRVGAVGVSGLPDGRDDELAESAIEAAGLSARES
jgi:uncharacterized protein GlcG (DUF336 family)